MIKPEMVPDEVFEAFQKAWADKSTLSTKECIAAALSAWPGVMVNKFEWGKAFLSLPLPSNLTIVDDSSPQEK